nr:MAG TPA: hypothetical protein [Caudoviricetes sp.]
MVNGQISPSSPPSRFLIDLTFPYLYPTDTILL